MIAFVNKFLFKCEWYLTSIYYESIYILKDSYLLLQKSVLKYLYTLFPGSTTVRCGNRQPPVRSGGAPPAFSLLFLPGEIMLSFYFNHEHENKYSSALKIL